MAVDNKIDETTKLKGVYWVKVKYPTDKEFIEFSEPNYKTKWFQLGSELQKKFSSTESQSEIDVLLQGGLVNIPLDDSKDVITTGKIKKYEIRQEVATSSSDITYNQFYNFVYLIINRRNRQNQIIKALRDMENGYSRENRRRIRWAIRYLQDVDLDEYGEPIDYSFSMCMGSFIVMANSFFSMGANNFTDLSVNNLFMLFGIYLFLKGTYQMFRVKRWYKAWMKDYDYKEAHEFIMERLRSKE